MEPTTSKNNASVALLEKRKEMMIIQDALHNKRKDFDNKVDQLKHREKNLLQHRNELTETIINLDKYIKENDRKRTQNLMKVKTERMLCDKAEGDMNKQVQEMNQRLAEKSEKERLFQEHFKKYQDYLQKVASHQSEESSDDIDSLLLRYQVLEENNLDLHRQKSKFEDAIVKQRLITKQYENDAALTILKMNSELGTLNQDLEHYRSQTTELKDSMDHSLRQEMDTRVVIGQIQLTCEHLLQRVQLFSKITRKPKAETIEEEVSACLQTIGTTLADFKYIVEQVIPKLTEEERQKIFTTPSSL